MKYLSIEEKYDPFRRHVDELHKLNSRKKEAMLQTSFLKFTLEFTIICIISL